MATRPVFEVFSRPPFYKVRNVDFIWNKGLNITQKRKNVVAVHDAFHAIFPEKRVLEISSKSLQPEGLPLSAFNLQKYVPSLGKTVCVENLYQGGKVFRDGGPYTEIYDYVYGKGKRDERLHSSGPIIGFYYEGVTYPVRHFDAVYNWLYINALIENPDLSAPLLDYDAFTDISFNPNKMTSCQAKSAAIFVSLSKLGKLDAVADYDTFVRLVYGK